MVEVHTRVELATALDAGATVIGVNSRDLDTFAVDIDTAWKLLAEVPIDRIAVAESGLVERQDVARAAEAGADAVLIGTALSAAESPAVLLRELSMVPRHGR